MDDLLRDMRYLLQDIQGSRKGSVGNLDDTYLPRLNVERIDELAVRVSTCSVQDIDRATRAQEWLMKYYHQWVPLDASLELTRVVLS